MVVNFLHAKSWNYFVTAVITVSRKFASMGRKSCLFVCYQEQICTELWMVEGVAALNGGLRRRIVEGKIRSRIRERRAMQASFSNFFSFHQIQEIVGWASCASSC